MPYAQQKISLFRWILFLWMGLVYLWGISLGRVVEEQISPDRIFLFTLLMLLHLGLYSISMSLSPRFTWYRLLYFVIQSLLVLLVSFVAHRQTVTIGLYLALLGEMTSILYKIRAAIVMIVAYLLLFILNITMLYGWEYVHFALLYIIPLSLVIIGYVLLFTRQAQAHAQTQALLHELEIAHRQLANYSLRIEELTRTAERRRMARELHDTLAQGLAGLTLQLEAVKSHLVDHHYERALEIVIQAMGRTRTSLAAARCAIDDLRTETITLENLQQVIQDEIDRFTAATSIPCTTHLSCLTGVSDTLCEYIVRIVAEGLMNVAQHAQAHYAWVRIEKKDEELIIEIRDDGIGFDAATMSGKGHYGLLGLRERARLLGGQFALITAPDQGTTLQLRLPANTRGDEQ